MRRAVVRRLTVKVDKAELLRKIDVDARRAILAVKGARDPVQPPHIAQHLELVGDELLIGGRTGVIDDQPSLRAIELACALGIHELVVIDLPITENVAKGDLAQVQAGGVGDAPDATVRRDFQAARSEEHTSELHSLMRISYAVFLLK